jgi:hypothetical protein
MTYVITGLSSNWASKKQLIPFPKPVMAYILRCPQHEKPRQLELATASRDTRLPGRFGGKIRKHMQELQTSHPVDMHSRMRNLECEKPIPKTIRKGKRSPFHGKTV